MKSLTRHHLSPGQWHLKQCGIKNIDDYAVFELPFPYCADFEHQVTQALIENKPIVILCSELHDSTVEFIRKYQNPQITYFTCGIIRGVKSQLWMDWFATTTDIYKSNKLLDQLEPFQPKNKMFDILLGQRRSHRDFVYNFVHTNQLTEHVIMSYIKDHTRPLAQQGFITDVDIDQIKHTVESVNYQGRNISLSQIIPFDIYNETAYSVVTETNASNDYNFYTEKIVKPILARRLFLVFAGKHYLKNLRSMGFCTFEGILDERYDDVEDSVARHNLVCEQMYRLIQMPQQEVLNSIQPILEHNQRVMLETDWLGNFHQALSLEFV